MRCDAKRNVGTGRGWNKRDDGVSSSHALPRTWTKPRARPSVDATRSDERTNHVHVACKDVGSSDGKRTPSRHVRASPIAVTVPSIPRHARAYADAQQGVAKRTRPTNAKACRSLGLLGGVFVGVRLDHRFAVMEDVAELAPDPRVHAHATKHGRHDVQQGRLGGVEHQHDQDGRAQSQDVSKVRAVEITGAVRVVRVVPQNQRHEDARDHDVTQSKHGKGLGQSNGRLVEPREEQLDRGFERFGHAHHHGGAEHPKNVVKE
mmetsp:Transcript_9829/g.59844  ORF Transcript_9829/g.59844 Transcript_9829/m.59844 type:complete len:262 (-) Transcript_9829:667-1452(-)